MDIMHDGRGNPYVNVDNLRITFIRRGVKDDQKDWEGDCHYLRVQAYRGGNCGSLHRSAEFPIPNHGKALELLSVISGLLAVELEAS